MGYLNTNQIGAILGFQGRTIREMCRKGEIPAIEVGGEYRIEKREFREWLAAQKVKGASPVPAAAPKIAEAQ